MMLMPLELMLSRHFLLEELYVFIMFQLIIITQLLNFDTSGMFIERMA